MALGISEVTPQPQDYLDWGGGVANSQETALYQPPVTYSGRIPTYPWQGYST